MGVGIISAAIVGFLSGAFDWIGFLVSVGNGIAGMGELIIITTGGIANDISKRFGISPQKTASILDTFSCLVQGLIPYGAQILLAAGLFSISPASIIPVLYYPMIMGVFAILSIVFDYPHSQKKLTIAGLCHSFDEKKCLYLDVIYL